VVLEIGNSIYTFIFKTVSLPVLLPLPVKEFLAVTAVYRSARTAIVALLHLIGPILTH